MDIETFSAAFPTQPNINDARVKKTFTKSLGFVKGYFRHGKPRECGSRFMDKFFGASSNYNSRYLREILLVETKHNWSIERHECKEYELNNLGAWYIKEVIAGKTTSSFPEWLQGHSDTPFEVIKEKEPVVDKKLNKIDDYTLIEQTFIAEYGDQLHTKNFKYDLKSNRLWNPLQNIKSEHRKRLFAKNGFNHAYDIASCAPRLITQYALMYGLEEAPMTIFAMLDEPKGFRERISDETGISVVIIKRVINAIFNGASIGFNPDSDVYKMLNGNAIYINKLKYNKTIIALRSEIKQCWAVIEPTMMMRFSLKKKKNGELKKIPVSAKTKASKYRELEYKVMNCIYEYLDSIGNGYFCEHDGFFCVDEIDIQSLTEHVETKLGFRLKFSHEVISSNIE